ncbi:MAG: hypothetical protein LUI14_05125 [Lachnospiraceae bacterium]|nr:hypothetical protein [Lachnospiraceae bacterium]
MKKEYMAPDLYFESFVLSESIAAGCTEEGQDLVNTWSSVGFFLSVVPSGYTACSDDYNESGGETYCYWDGQNKVYLS